MKFAMLITLIALGVAGCKSTDSDMNTGAPPAGYQTSAGAGQSWSTDPNQVTHPNPWNNWNNWRFQGITPTTP
jgi:hypothetical protein